MTTSPTERAALATRSDHTPVELSIAARSVLHAIDDLDRAVAAVRRVLNPRASLPGHEGEAMPCRFCHRKPVRYAGGLIQLCEAHEKAWRVHDRPIHPDGTVDVDTLRARIDEAKAQQAPPARRTKKKGK